jgi:NAD(P)-dependent dehydrogenase (short-subunit alcohol dehydrogenase family)
MAKIFITGSTDGIGLLAAKSLIAQGHKVVLHARNEARGEEGLENAPGAEGLVTADLSNIDETKQLAEKVNALGKFDAVIHNAGVYNASSNELITVNVLAPYILTCLIARPRRLIYVSSDMHLSGHARLENLENNFEGFSYSDSKLLVLMLCKAITKRWPEVYANALHPGWVPTKMGGSSAPDALEKGYETQVWLASGNDEKANTSGKYFFHKKESRYSPEADDPIVQEKFIQLCGSVTGIKLT